MNKFPFIACLILAFCICSCAVKKHSEPQNAVRSNDLISPNHEESSQDNFSEDSENHAENVIEKVNQQVKIQEQIAAHEACFSVAHVIFDQPFVLSSLQAVPLSNNQTAILLETPAGDIKLILLDQAGNVFENKTLAPYAQISCTDALEDGFRVGIIERDPVKATYSLEILKFNNQGEQIPDKDWHAITRGFIPDPGTRCAFLNHSSLLATGTKLRHTNKPPYHGMFNLQSDAILFYAETHPHVPDIIEAYSQDDHGVIHVREVQSDAENKSRWTHALYMLAESEQLISLQKGDFIAAKDPHAPVISSNGCYMGRDNSLHCPMESPELTEVISLRGACDEYPEDNCMVWQSRTAAWMVKMTSTDKPQMSPISPVRVFYPYYIKRASKVWLSAEKDTSLPDVGKNLHFSTIHASCLW